MNIAILGATGTFGTALTNSLLNHTEYQLTLLSHHAENYYQNSERITAINIDATNAEDLRTSLHGTNVCVRRTTPDRSGKSCEYYVFPEYFKTAIYECCWDLQ